MRRHEAIVGRLSRDTVVPDFADGVVGRIDDANSIATVRTVLS
ncbi:hypothetical protein [Streptomyces sp. NPDC058701]